MTRLNTATLALTLGLAAPVSAVLIGLYILVRSIP